MTPFGISKKDIINMGRLLKTELSETSFPRKIGILPSSKKVFVQAFFNLLPFRIQELSMVHWDP
jgi:hypothetical protein